MQCPPPMLIQAGTARELDVPVLCCFLPSCHLTLVLWESEEAEQCVPGCPEVPRLTAGAGFCRQTHTPGASSELAEAQPLEGWNKHAFPRETLLVGQQHSAVGSTAPAPDGTAPNRAFTTHRGRTVPSLLRGLQFCSEPSVIFLSWCSQHEALLQNVIIRTSVGMF